MNASSLRARPRVLVIDDDEIALIAICDILEGAGFDVESLSSPIGATRAIVEKNVEIAVVDLNMPVIRGDRLVSLLQSWDRIRSLPVVLISGADTTKLDAISAAMPGVAIVSKKQMRSELPKVVHKALARSVPRPSSLAPAPITDIEVSFARECAATADAGRAVWSEATMRAVPTAEFVERLRTLSDQARLLGIDAIARIGLAVVTATEGSRGKPRPELARVVRQALDGLADPKRLTDPEADRLVAAISQQLH